MKLCDSTTHTTHSSSREKYKFMFHNLLDVILQQKKKKKQFHSQSREHKVAFAVNPSSCRFVYFSCICAFSLESIQSFSSPTRMFYVCYLMRNVINIILMFLTMNMNVLVRNCIADDIFVILYHNSFLKVIENVFKSTLIDKKCVFKILTLTFTQVWNVLLAIIII